MLRISTIESQTRRQWVLEGKLVAPWTDELRSIWQQSACDADFRERIIDIRGVTAISADGEDVLLELMVQGAKFRGSDVFTKQILKQLERRAHRNGQEDDQRHR